MQKDFKSMNKWKKKSKKVIFLNHLKYYLARKKFNELNKEFNKTEISLAALKSIG